MRIRYWSSDVCSADLLTAMNAKPDTVPCSRCAKYDVPAPDSIEEDPLCPGCIRVLMFQAADQVFGKLHDRALAVGHTERSEVRRVGTECVSMCTSRFTPFHYKKKISITLHQYK